jgi:hypothetical protein
MTAIPNMRTMQTLGNADDVKQILQSGPIVLTHRGRAFAVVVLLPAALLLNVDAAAESLQRAAQEWGAWPGQRGEGKA